MNEFDKDNLEFILHSPRDEFEAWMEEADTDTLAYAMKLIRDYRLSLLEEEQEYLDDELDDTSDALAILKRFTLGG